MGPHWSVGKRMERTPWRGGGEMSELQGKKSRYELGVYLKKNNKMNKKNIYIY